MTSFKISRPSGRAKYSDLFERLLDPVFLLDQESFVILEANPAAETRFADTFARLQAPERSPQEATNTEETGLDFRGRELTHWLAVELHDEFNRALRMARRSHHPRKIRLPWIACAANPENPVHFEAVLCCLDLDGQTSVIQVILHDITLETRTRAELEALSSIDEMTQISNYRRFKVELGREHQRVQAEGGAYAIVFCDVDHFKKYNDREGHPAGDALLRQLADLLKSRCRTTDLPARYGGEEFAVLCRGTPAQGALIFAERLRTVIESHPFAGGAAQPLGRITISIGIAGYPTHGMTPQLVLERADKALYCSKNSGRNRITLASDVTPASNERNLK